MTRYRSRWMALRRLLKRRLPDPLYGLLRRVWRILGQTSKVSRDPRVVIWFRRAVLRRAPLLEHFDIHLTDHCNLNCRGCTHFAGLSRPSFTRLDEFERDMREMSRLFSRVRQIYLLGGEPLLHPEVTAFVRLSREVFPNTRIHLLTNGTLVTRMTEGFWRALAETGVVLTISPYPVDLPMAEIDLLARRSGVALEVTTSRDSFHRIPIDPAGGHDAASSFAVCRDYNNCPMVRNGRLYPCAYTALADILREHFGIEELGVSDEDYIPLGPQTDSQEAMRFLRRPVPWCSNCDADSLSYHSWEPSSGDILEWIKEPDTCG